MVLLRVMLHDLVGFRIHASISLIHLSVLHVILNYIAQRQFVRFLLKLFLRCVVENRHISELISC